MTEAEHALTLADCLDKPGAPDGTFVGLSDSALIVKALRLFAMAGGLVELRMPVGASGGIPGAVSRLPAPSLPGAESGRQASA